MEDDLVQAGPSDFLVLSPTDREPVVQEIDCPRCHQACGWCGDYRWMHGQIKLPGLPARKCTVSGMGPDGKCALCGGSRRVLAATTYSKTLEG